MGVEEKEEKSMKRGIYKVTRTSAKVAITEAKTTAFETLYAAIGDKCGDKKLYRFVKMREGKAQGLYQVKDINDKDDKVLANQTFIK